MSTIRNPVGPQPPRVYWRRRLLVALGLAVLILIIVLIIVRPGAGKPTAGNTPTPRSTTSTKSTSNSDAITSCANSDVAVKAVTDATTYAPGVDPKLSLSIENTGTKACTFAAGSNVQVYTITSGTETIWSSKDCQKNAVAKTVTLQPGAAVTSAPFAWDRTRSDAADCSPKNPKQVVAGGASYHLTVSVSGVASSNDIQFILK